MKTQEGRDDAFIKKRIRSKMIGKGCTSETTQPVFRLKKGGKVFRCPRAIADDYGVMSHYHEYSSIRDNLFYIKENDKPWKWHEIMQIVRSEIAAVNKPKNDNPEFRPKVSSKR